MILTKDQLSEINQFEYSFDNWTIERNRVEAIKEFKCGIIDSYYFDKMFSISLNENIDIVNKYKSEDETTENFFMCCMCDLQILAMFVNLDLKGYETLLRETYWSIDEWNEEDCTDTFITLGHKRPFGNSDIETDVLTAMGVKQIDGEYTEEQVEMAQEMLMDFYTDKLPFFVKNLPTDFYTQFVNFGTFRKLKSSDLSDEQRKFSKTSLRSWTLDQSEFRNNKINQIL